MNNKRKMKKKKEVHRFKKKDSQVFGRWTREGDKDSMKFYNAICLVQ
jgi:hypothetical protein